jgi:hypothetical protein
MNILHQFFTDLREEDSLHGVIQQVSAKAHTTHISLKALREVFGNSVISSGPRTQFPLIQHPLFGENFKL